MIVFLSAATGVSGRRWFPERRVGDPPSAFAWMLIVYLAAMLGMILA